MKRYPKQEDIIDMSEPEGQDDLGALSLYSSCDLQREKVFLIRNTEFLRLAEVSMCAQEGLGSLRGKPEWAQGNKGRAGRQWVAHMAATQGGPDEERLCLEEKISGGGEYCNLRNKRTETKS